MNSKLSNPIQKVLVIEKYTDYECLELDKLEKMESLESEEELKRLHQEHLDSRQILIDSLQANKIEFHFLKKDQISERSKFEYQAIVSLGGDGTFLKSAQITEKKLIVGINSQPSKSVGHLTPFKSGDLPELFQKLKNGDYEFQFWERLGVRLNGYILDYKAVNEVYIGIPQIYKTSHLQLEFDGQTGSFSGNGLVVSAHQGSTAFYKSGGGSFFKPGNFGYSILLPYKISSNLPQSMVLLAEDILVIKPQRLHHRLIFDSDYRTQTELGQNDRIEVFIDSDNPLKVAHLSK